MLFTSQVSYASLVAAAGQLTGAATAIHLGLVYDYPSPLFQWAIQRISLGVAPSDHTRDGWLQRGWPSRSLRTIPNGVPIHQFAPGPGRSTARKRLGLDENIPIVAYVGRLVREKGVFTLLQAFAQIHRTTPNCCLLFIGAAPGPEASQLRALAQSLQLGATVVRILPPTSAPEEFYRAADIVVVPSEWDEPFGLAPLEAAACGTLTLVSDRGILPSFVAPLGPQAVFPSGNSAALAERIAFWLADPSHRALQSSVLATFVRSQFDFTQCGDSYLAAFEALRSAC
jgi:glycosyltransferase involved in cell wall biosynthesis